jgi:hypothetical protein
MVAPVGQRELTALRKANLGRMDAYRGASVSAVIAGLDPAIHLFRKNFDTKKMDPRVKPAGDAAGRGKCRKDLRTSESGD